MTASVLRPHTRWQGPLLALLWLAAAVLCLQDFGPTWDCGQLHVGDQVAGFLRDPAASGFDSEGAAPVVHRQPAPRLPTDLKWTLSNVPAETLASASCSLLWDVLGWLPAMSGYLVATALWFALLLAALAGFGERHCGRGAGLLAALVLALLPRVGTEAIANFKDIPECACFAFAALAGFAALRSGTTRAWTLCGALAGLAAAMRPNGLFLPVVLLPMLLVAVLRRGSGTTDGFRAPRPRALAAAAAAYVFAVIAALPPVWCDPVGRLHERFVTYMTVGRVANGSVSWESVWLAFATAPPTVLAAALLGLFARRAPLRVRLFLLVWLAVPLLRTALPGMRHFDGIRHFLEFTVPLALLAGTGVAAAIARASTLRRPARWLASALPLLPIAESAVALARTYPYGTCWFSPVVGGLRGAQADGVQDASDYWCNSYWEAAAWLEANAERDALVVCPIAVHVLEAIVPLRWRADLRLATPDAEPGAVPLYVVYATRQAMYPRWLREMRAAIRPVHVIEVQGAPILEVLRLHGGEGAALAALKQLRAQAMAQSLVEELQGRRPQDVARLWAAVQGAAQHGEAASLAQLRELFPARTDADLLLALWPYLPPR